MGWNFLQIRKKKKKKRKIQSDAFCPIILKWLQNVVAQGKLTILDHPVWNRSMMKQGSSYLIYNRSKKHLKKLTLLPLLTKMKKKKKKKKKKTQIKMTKILARLK